MDDHQAYQRLSPEPCNTPRSLRSASLVILASAISFKSNPTSEQILAKYHRTSPSSLRILNTKSAVGSPSKSRYSFLTLSATSPDSPHSPRAGYHKLFPIAGYTAVFLASF